MEVIADYYGIPSIHLGLEAVRLEKEGMLIMKAPEVKVEKVSGEELDQNYKLPLSAEGKIHFSKDGVHPSINTGHQLYMEAIAIQQKYMSWKSKYCHINWIKETFFLSKIELISTKFQQSMKAIIGMLVLFLSKVNLLINSPLALMGW